MKSLGSGIASLGAGIGRMIASIGKGGGVGIAAIFQGLSTGVASLGKVSVLKGVGVMTLLAAPVFLVGEAFKSWADVKWQDVALGIGAITGLAVVAGVIGNGFFVPILLGAAALGALGLALQLFPVDTITALGDVLNKVVNTVMVNMPPIITAVGDALAKLIEVGAKGFDTIMNSVGTLLERMNLLDPVRLAEVAGAITLVGGSLAALGLGSVIGGIGKFMGSLFGGGDPLDRLLKVADSAPKLDQLSESLKKLAVVIGETGGMIERLSVLPLESVVDDFSRLWKNLSKVELNVKPYLDFTALDTDKMIQNAEAINRVAMANKKQNEAYQEFIKLDNNNFRRNVEAAFDMNAAARGQTSRDSLTETISNLFSSLFRSPATPTPPTATNPAAPPNATPSGSSTTGQTIPPVPTPIERNARGQTQLDVLTQIQFDIQAQKTILEAIRDHTQ
jgi:hypothetical protein